VSECFSTNYLWHNRTIRRSVKTIVAIPDEAGCREQAGPPREQRAAFGQGVYQHRMEVPLDPREQSIACQRALTFPAGKSICWNQNMSLDRLLAWIVQTVWKVVNSVVGVSDL